MNERIPLVWNVTVTQETNLDKYGSAAANSTHSTDSSENATSGGSSSGGKQPFVIVHSAIHLCSLGEEASACDPFSTSFRNANLTVNQVANLSRFSGEDSIAFTSNDEVSFPSPGEFTIAAYLIIPGVGQNQRHDFVVYTSIRVHEQSTSVQIASDEDSKSGRPLGVSTGQFVIICVLIVLFIGCVLTLVVIATKRRRRWQQQQREHDAHNHEAKVSQTAALSPITGDSPQFRFSDWTEIYATQDNLPSSILVDDSNTIAILRASRVSSSPASSTERRVADFTRGGGFWDVRPSASPITPLSSMSFPHLGSSSSSSLRDDRELASPVDGFVPLETLGRRRTRPCHGDALDGFSGSDEEDEEQEVEF